MSKIPFKSKKNGDCGDDKDEIVSFESFCNENSAGLEPVKSDILTLNDNINYHLFYDNRDNSNADPSGSITSASANNEDFIETSLTGLNPKYKGSAPPKTNNFFKSGGKSAFLGKLKSGNSNSSPRNDDNLRYERFSPSERSACSRLPSIGSGVLIIMIVCVLCVAVWWGVWGLIGGPWGEEHYRRLWEKAHPNHNQQTHYSPSVIVHQQLERLEPVQQSFETKYHDHNNLSTKNKASALGNGKKQKIEIVRKNIALLGELQESDNPPIPDSKECRNVIDDLKFDCFPEGGASELGCKERGCCWVGHNQSKHPMIHYHTKRRTHGAMSVPYCFYPPNYSSYQYVNITETKEGITALLERQFRSPYKNDATWVKLEITYLSDTVLQIKISDAENTRFEPPYPTIPILPLNLVNPLYRVEIEALKLGFKIVRNTDNLTVMDTQGVGGFTFADKFLQLSTLLPSAHIYGLGEHRARFPLNILWQRYTLFNHDTRPNENTNLYGSHPFYMVMETTGRSHGVFLLNSNAMDVILQPAPALTYRTIGGIFNFLVFLGPSPKDVVAQYTSFIGRPFMPPYWSLGFHLCKYDYGSLNATRDVWQRTRNAGIPYDVQWNDLDYMNNSNDFTYDRKLFGELPLFVKNLHSYGMHYIPLIDPGVSASEKRGTYPPFDRGLEMNIFIKNQSGLPFVGKVWNKATTVWPDFTHPNATAYWVEMMASLHKDIPFDGAWIDMNEPSNFLSGPIDGSCAPEDLEYTPGVSGGNGLKSGTICMEVEQFAGSHYNLHNLYSITEAIATNFALAEIRGKRPFIISRSTFAGLGKYAGHWSGDNYSDWYDMKMTIPELLMFSLFGIPMMGADICGFNGNTTVELCRRWMELGAFYPFARNHNSDSSSPQDPAFLGSTVVEASKRALITRYTLLPYLYTLFWKAHIDGDTVAMPTFFEFPGDIETYDLDQQFMWGSSLLIAPILDPNVESVRAYIPNSQWYKFNGSSPVETTGWVTLNDGETLLVQGGNILPLQQPNQRKNKTINTSTLRSQPLQLLVALSDKQIAQGELFWDDGDSLNTYEEMKFSHIIFSAMDDSVESQVVWWGYGVPPVNKVTIMGVKRKIAAVFINSKSVNFTYYSDRKLLLVEKINIALDKPFILIYRPVL